MVKHIYLVRHGETDFNTDPVPRIRGRVMNPLNELGRKHAREVGEALKDVRLDLIYYSAITRAKQTAEAIHAHQPQAKYIEEPLVIDISWGDWEGKTYAEAFGTKEREELFKRDPAQLEIPNGESFYQVLARLEKLLHQIRESAEETVCIVSHGAVLNLLMCMITEAPLRSFWVFYGGACSISQIDLNDNGTFSIKSYNRMEHLTN
ncbi:Histidine phosphatase superfamily protein [Giardia muris]|uniref:Histidine phosphatase superfamily protein n=1 Tax=Giardia muris TaxID=5742 RepID=A0A4Z1SXW2_GIAMU|nr:Histidine phosphatase superfamily protein [Giardia muris]|eukprot:TNJ26523.1 Histidine phosphatase superfamily protein [Giardia muris]